MAAPQPPSGGPGVILSHPKGTEWERTHGPRQLAAGSLGRTKDATGRHAQWWLAMHPGEQHRVGLQVAKLRQLPGVSGHECLSFIGDWLGSTGLLASQPDCLTRFVSFKWKSP